MTSDQSRLGVLVPASNTTAEPELSRATPSTVTVHAARMPLGTVTPEGLSAMADTATAAADRLMDAPIEAVMYACTTGSLLEGPSYARTIEAQLATRTERPTVVTARSVDRALRALDADRIAITTPYVDTLVDRERSYFDALGYNVQAIDGRGIADNHAIGALAPTTAADAATAIVEQCSTQPDAVFISCTNYRTFPVIERLERELSIPVVSSNTATLWDGLHQAGLDPAPVPGTLSDRSLPDEQ